MAIRKSHESRNFTTQVAILLAGIACLLHVGCSASSAPSQSPNVQRNESDTQAPAEGGVEDATVSPSANSDDLDGREDVAENIDEESSPVDETVDVLPPEPVDNVSQLEAQRRRLDETLWKPEVEAQRYEQTFVKLWDRILAADVEEKSALLANFPLSQLIHRSASTPLTMDLGIRRWKFDGEGVQWNASQWSDFVKQWASQGYRLEEVEFHHSSFQPAAGDAPARSTVSFVLHIAREEPAHRAVVRGNLNVEWAVQPDKRGKSQVEVVRVNDLEILDRQQQPTFVEVLHASTDAEHPRVMPIIARDLSGDGLSEIIVGGLNRVYDNLGDGKFEPRALTDPGIDMFDAAVVADFNSDGHDDLICVARDRHPRLCAGDGTGGFESPGVRCADFAMEIPKSFTAGDIDGDGDLDLFIGQYKFPYSEGAMPTPFYDANDGYPAVLLENDGEGRFTDVTIPAGLAAKRHRRIFSSSFIDYDEDGDLDLLVVSDFAGVDLYQNDGNGKFRDVTEDLIDEPHHFGMAHTFGDYNNDGLLDMYIIGMSSTTARRLDRMKLQHPDHPDIDRHRAAMGYGNRLFQWQGDRFNQPKWRSDVARTGWSWGTTSFDFDNDGDRDIYVVNGHNSGRSTQDYCTRYWCHDVYTGSSKPDLEVFKLFGDSLKELHAGDISWNGYEHNVLLMNDQGSGFDNIGYLLGVAFEFDCRGLVSDDLDADGRPDLIVVEHDSQGLGKTKYHLHALLNKLETDNHWIGVRLAGSKGVSSIGAKVTLTYEGGTQIARIVTGDSFSSQHAPVVHFGLGEADAVDAIDILWPNGQSSRIKRPQVDAYHIAAPPRS